MKDEIIIGLGTSLMVACTIGVVLLFFIAFSQGMITGDYNVTINFNGVGEFWWELPLVIFMVPFAGLTVTHLVLEMWRK